MYLATPDLSGIGMPRPMPQRPPARRPPVKVPAPAPEVWLHKTIPTSPRPRPTPPKAKRPPVDWSRLIDKGGQLVNAVLPIIRPPTPAPIITPPPPPSPATPDPLPPRGREAPLFGLPPTTWMIVAGIGAVALLAMRRGPGTGRN